MLIGGVRVKNKSIEELKDLVKQGNTKAMYVLAYKYYYGWGVTKDTKIAFNMFKELAEKYEDKSVSYYLGEIYYFGNIVERDYEKAFEYITKALEYNSKDNDAKYYLGLMLYDGNGTEKDEEKAVKIFEELYNKFEYDPALLMLAEAYYYSSEKDFAKAYEYCNIILDNSDRYIKSSEEEDRIKEILGNLYYYGQYVEKDYEKALKYYKGIVNDKKGIIAFNIGLRYYYKKTGEAENQQNAFEYFKKSAEKGHPMGQFFVGQAYLCGEGTEIDDKKAVYWYEKASVNGNSLAKHRLAMLYYYGEENGIDIKKDAEYAIQLLEEAADDGNEEAKKDLEKIQKNKKEN
mgnify:FL=1